MSNPTIPDESDEFEEVRTLLTSWGLPEYVLVNTFQENAVTSNIMAILCEEDINALFPKLGHRALFKRNWKQWVQDMHPNLNKSEEQLDRFCTELGLSPLDLDSQDVVILNEVPVDIENCLAGPSGEELIEESPSTSHESNNNNSTLRNLLEESLEGKFILSKSSEYFNDGIRSKLCKLICLQILKDNINKPITSDIYVSWVHEIKSIFPKEHCSVYFYRCLRDGSKGIVSRIQGKLPDMVHNLRKKYKAANVLENVNKNLKSKKSSPSLSETKKRRLDGRRLSIETVSESHSCDSTVEDSIQWLKNSSDPWIIVEEKWAETNGMRMTDIRAGEGQTIFDNFKQYPALSNPKGYMLLIKDYELGFPNNVDGLQQNFPILKPEVFKLAEKKSGKDPQIKVLLELQNSTEETTNLASFLLLPHLLNVGFVKGHKKSWRPSKIEVQDSFICYVSSDTELATTLSQRRKKVADCGLTFQPSIFIVGQSLKSITSYFVVVDQVRYRLPNILSAVDTCYKIMWALNAQYPVEAQNVWYLLQVGCYKLNTEFDPVSTSVKSILVQLGLQN